MNTSTHHLTPLKMTVFSNGQEKPITKEMIGYALQRLMQNQNILKTSPKNSTLISAA